MTDRLNRFQRIAADTYANGDYRHLTDPEQAKADDNGDTLITFIMRELDEPEDANDAVKRLDTAIRELEEVRDALRLSVARRCGECGALLTDRATDEDGRPTYCDECDRELDESEIVNGDDDDPARREPNNCPECARSHGPNYTGKCDH